MISLCICTYNRSESLRRTLETLVRQDNIDLAEVLIVDNNCTDGTAEVVASFGQRLAIRLVTETRQGLAHARNRAAAEFRGDVLLFTDDDIRFETGWLMAYQNAVRSYPDADYFGGRILPDWGEDKPRWIKGEPLPLIDGILGWFDHGAESRLIRSTEQPPFGASFAVRRRLFEQIGFFRIDLGTGGAGLGRGEETEFLTRARQAGAQGVYVGGALCFHAYDPKRLTLIALYRHGISCGRSFTVMMSTPKFGSYRAAARFVLRGLRQAVMGHGDRFRQCIINAGIQVGARPGHRGRA